ncbi:MAG: helix-turn-helix domain-containing protein [Pyrinomonadaceae bacterium]
MSVSLGEKLRQAREDKGLTLSEVSEHTRISTLYLQSIENDDYKILPGGIFNKGFVKSYAKFVGVNEQEALSDYANLIGQAETKLQEETPRYKPEVLTDDTSSGSNLPTILIAGVILAAMTAGILYLVSYFRQPAETVVTNTAPRANTNSAANTSANSSVETPASNTPDMASLNVEVKAINPVSVLSTVDGEPQKKTDVAAGSSVSFTPKESLTLNYNRWNAQNVQLAINGKAITLPTEPLDPKDRDRIIFTISKDNLAEIWTNGAISNTAPPAVTEANANVNANAAVTSPTTQTALTPRQTPAPRPSVAPNAAANTAGPATTPIPAPTRKVVVVPSAPNTNRP